MRNGIVTRIHWRGKWTGPAEFERRIGAAIAGLDRMGVRERDAVGISGANSLDWIALAMAIGRIGAVLVPLSPRLGPREIAWQVERAGVGRLFADTAHLANAPAQAHAIDEVFDAARPGSRLLPVLDPRRPETILFTSGTTGRPKAAVLTIRNRRAHARASASALGIRPEDRWLLCMPLFHVGGLNIVHRCLHAGIDIILHDSFAPDEVNQAIEEEGVTIVSFVETMLRRVIEARGGRAFPPNLRAIVVGGGPVGDDLIDAHPGVLASYGLTESCSMVTLVSHSASPKERHSAGRPLPGVRIRIVDEEGGELPIDSEGEVEVRGPVVMKGYLRERAATRAAIHDGWLRTGDVGRIDAAGLLHVVARRDDLILSGGENIYPAEIEGALRGHPSVADLVVIGIDDPEWGQRPLALVIARGIPPADGVLERFLEERIARYKIPRIVLAGEIPRLPNGKPDRAEIRARYAGGR